jgi:hypothetical protein
MWGYGWRYGWGRKVRTFLTCLCVAACAVIFVIAAWRVVHRNSYVTTYGTGNYSVQSPVPLPEASTPNVLSTALAPVSPVSASPMPSRHTVTTWVTVTAKPKASG